MKKYLKISFVAIIFILPVVFFILKNKAPEKLDPTPGPFSYIEEKAKQLDLNPEKILKYVKDEVKNEDYSGYLRGAVGTLWSEAGNDIDKCSLIIELLKYANTETKLLKDKEGYFIQYQDQEKWETFFPVQEREVSQFEELNDFPEESRHKLEIIVRSYSNDSEYKENIVYKNDVAFYVDKKNVFEWDEGLRGVLSVGEKIIRGSESVGEASKVIMIFNVYSSNEKKKEYQRTIFDVNQEVGHRKVSIQDKYTLVFLPNFMDLYVFEKEAELVNQDKEKMSNRDRVVNRNYLMSIGFAVLSDVNTGNILEYSEGDGYFTSPRIIITATELEMLGETEISNQSVDLLKNDIHVLSQYFKEINSMRGIFDNIIEGMTLSAISKQECITTANLFKELYQGDYGYSDDTFSSRLSLYGYNLTKLLNENIHMMLTISCEKHSIKLENSASTLQNEGLTLLIDNNERDLIESGSEQKIVFTYDKDRDLFFKEFKGTQLEELLTLIEDVFINKFQLGINYEPDISRTILDKRRINFSRTNHLIYDVTQDGQNFLINSYLRQGEFAGNFSLELISSPGNIPVSLKTTFPEKFGTSIHSLVFNEDLRTQGIFTIGVESLERSFDLSSRWEVFDEEEDYELIINGWPTVLKAKVLKDKLENVPTKIWVWENNEYVLVLRVVYGQYSHELKSISNSDIMSMVKGSIIDKENKRGINNAEVNLAGDFRNLTWGDGSFEIYHSEKQSLTENSILLLLDNSASMDEPLKGESTGISKYKLAVEAASFLVENLSANTEVLSHDFASLDYWRDRRPFSFDKKKILDMISRKGASIGTPLTKAVFQTTDLMKKLAAGNKQRVILLSDGENTDKGETMVDAYKRINFNLPFFTIGFDIDPGGKAEKELRAIAETSGGKYLRAENISELKEAFVSFSKPGIENIRLAVKADGYKVIQKEISSAEIKNYLQFELEREGVENKDKFVVLSKENLFELNDLAIRDQAKRLIHEKILVDENIRILVPRNMVDYNFMRTIGWWEFNTLTGEATGRTEDGLHGATYTPGALIGGALMELLGEQAGPLLELSSFVGGMYARTAGTLSGVIEYESLPTSNEWVELIDQHAEQFAETFSIYFSEEDYFERGSNLVSAVFRADILNYLLDLIIDSIL